MGRISQVQKGTDRDLKTSPARKSQDIGTKALGVFFLIALALPLYWYGWMQQWLAPALQAYLPSALQARIGSESLLEVVTNQTTVPKLNLEQLLEACQTHQYTSEIISLDPLVIYINNFTSAQEAEELINTGSPDFAESVVSHAGANQRATGRTSSSAPLSMDLPIVSCLLARARTFMGSMMLPHEPFSTPQIVRYFPSQRYDLHTDFWPEHQVMNDGSDRLFNRPASFFVFLRDNCTEGYTYFPHVEPAHSSPKAPADLEALYHGKVARGGINSEGTGVKFKPIQGNAVFWVNIDEHGKGDRRVIHAGLPVGEGEKIGLNIWPRKFYGSADDDEQQEPRKEWSGTWKE